jgi:hypothetical protein
MQRGEIMTHNVPLGQQGRMHPWGYTDESRWLHSLVRVGLA